MKTKSIEPRKTKLIKTNATFFAPTIAVEDHLINDCPYPDDFSREIDEQKACRKCIFFTECVFMAKALSFYLLPNEYCDTSYF